MNDLKPMPEGEKSKQAMEMVRLYQKHVLPFVEEHLGFDEMYNLRSIWQAAITPILEGANDHDRYTQVYSNWLWIAHCSHNAMADQLSSEEVLEYKRLLLRLYLRQMDRSELVLLRWLNWHVALAKAMLYQMQWMTPMELTTCSRSVITCLVPSCKIRQISGTDRICRVDCQNVGTTYARQLYHIKRETLLTEHGCKITLTPLDHQPD